MKPTKAERWMSSILVATGTLLVSVLLGQAVVVGAATQEWLPFWERWAIAVFLVAYAALMQRRRKA